MPFTQNNFIINPETEAQIFARSCTQCNSGMNAGYLLDDSSPFCSKKCVQNYWNINDNNIDSHIDDAIAEDQLYWTEWEEIGDFNDYEWFAKDGTQGDIETLIPVLFSKYLAGEADSFNDGVRLLSHLAQQDSDFPLEILLTGNNNADFNKIIEQLERQDHKSNYIKEIIKLKSLAVENKVVEYFVWTVENTIVSMGKFNSIDDALGEVEGVRYNWVASKEDLTMLKADALSIIDQDEDEMWYALYMNGDIDKLGIYQSSKQANDNHPDDIICYMNTEDLNTFIAQIALYEPMAYRPSIKASINEGFRVDNVNKKIEIEIKDADGKVVSEFYDNKFEAEHRIGWIAKQDTSSWDDIGDYDMGPTQQIALTADGFRSMGSFIAGSRPEYDENGNKMIIFDEEVADMMFGDPNWAFISSEPESEQQLSSLQEIIANDKFVIMAGQDPWLYEGTNEVMVFLDAQTALEHAKNEDTDFDENDIVSYQSFLSEHCEGSIDKHWPELRVQADIVSSPPADYVALDTNGEIVAVYDASSFADAIEKMKRIYKETGTSFVEIVPLDQAKQWATELESLLLLSPEYKMEQPFGLDFDISDLNPSQISQWITEINNSDQPEKLHDISFNDKYKILKPLARDEANFDEYEVEVSFADQIGVPIHATMKDVYDKFLKFLEDTVINKDLTPFTFTPDDGNVVGMYTIFLAELEWMINYQDITAFEFKSVKVINENPHFIVNEDFTLKCVASADKAIEEHTHGWFDSDNNVQSLLAVLKSQDNGRPKKAPNNSTL